MQEWIRQTVESSQVTIFVLPVFSLVGMLAAVTSCCNIAALGAIAGYSASREDADRRTTVFAGLFFMVGTIIALVVLGAVAGFISQIAGTMMGRYWQIFAGVAAILLGLAALNLLPFRLPTLPSKERARPAAGLLSAAVFGLVVGGAATGCSVGCSPLLPVALGVAVLQGHTLWGAAILGAFAIGYSLPLTAILMGLSLGKSVLKTKKVATVVRISGGIVLTGVGFYLLATV